MPRNWLLRHAFAAHLASCDAQETLYRHVGYILRFRLPVRNTLCTRTYRTLYTSICTRRRFVGASTTGRGRSVTPQGLLRSSFCTRIDDGHGFFVAEKTKNFLVQERRHVVVGVARSDGHDALHTPDTGSVCVEALVFCRAFHKQPSLGQKPRPVALLLHTN